MYFSISDTEHYLETSSRRASNQSAWWSQLTNWGDLFHVAPLVNLSQGPKHDRNPWNYNKPRNLPFLLNYENIDWCEQDLGDTLA